MPRIYDLVSATGMDVSDWANYGRPQLPASNPRYCYEWSFLEPGKLVVLCLWHYDLEEKGGVIRWAVAKPLTGDEERVLRENPQNPQAVAMWRRRAARFDEHVATAWRDKLPVRVIIGDGTPGVLIDGEQTSARGTGRMLDPVPWAVIRFDQATRKADIVRGASPVQLVDQWTAHESDTGGGGPPKIVERLERPRSPAVRQAALQRSGGRCEYCGELGFETAAGVYLETHHMVPLSEGGPDTVENVIALCPKHHRMAHHSVERDQLRAKFSEQLGLAKPSRS